MSFTKLYFTLAATCWVHSAFADPAALNSADANALQAAPQGAVIVLQELWTNQRDLPRLPVTIADDHGPQFLFSDKPEYFYLGNGISMQEEVKPGVVRLYLYHVPQPDAGPKTISAVIENLGTSPMNLRFLRRALPTPGKNYFRIGKSGLIDYFNSKPEKSSRSIPAKGRAALDPQLDATTATTDQLVHGFYEFEIDQPARVTVFQRDPNQSSLEVIDTLPKLPRDIPGRIADGAGRGLFLKSNFTVTGENNFVLDTTIGPMRLALADNRTDHYIRGRDSIADLDSVTNSGNYGVMYHIHLKWRSSDGRGLALLMTKRGGSSTYCNGQAGAVQVSKGVWPGGIVAIPADRVSYGNPGEMVIVQKFPAPPKGRTGEIEITYSPPGASCIPTPMLFVPY
jgi:hypothetical protein